MTILEDLEKQGDDKNINEEQWQNIITQFKQQ